MNTSATYPETIKGVLEDLHENATGDWGDVWNAVTDERDRQLTESLCNSDSCDFIMMIGCEAFLFISNDQTGEWTVKHVGQPIYEIEPEMIGDDSIDFDEFLKEVQHELKGVEVKRGSALNNAKSVFVEWFNAELDRAFQTVLENQ